MADISKFFLVENGLSLDDNVAIFSGFADPSSGSGEAALLGSLFIRTNGQLWQKFGLADVDWQLVSNDGTSIKVSSQDTTTGYLNDKLTVTSSLLKTVVPSFPANQSLQLDLSPTGVNPGTYTQVTLDAKGRALSAFNPSTLSGYGITDAQPLHPNLTALSNISAGSPPVGLYTILASGVSAARAVVGTSSQISVANSDGIVGNPTVSLASNPTIPGASGMTVPKGAAVNEVALAPDGTLRYDTDLNRFRFKQNGVWTSYGQGVELFKENLVTPVPPISTGQNSIAIGEAAESTGQNSVAIGSSAAIGNQSTAIGNGARTESYGQLAFSARPFAAGGSSQGSEYMYSGRTIAQFPIELFLDGVSERAKFTQQNTALTFSALVIAQSVTNPGEMYSAKLDGQFFISPGSAQAPILSYVKSQFGASHQNMDVFLQTDIPNSTFNVMVKGRGGETWRWTVRVSTVENIL